MKCKHIIDKLEQLSPVKYAESWDNVGLLVGDDEQEIHTVYLAIDATDEVIKQALDMGADLLITHHPLIFRPISNISKQHFVGRRIQTLIANNISYYAMHTNFDVMGMADAASDELNLTHKAVLSVTYEDEIATEGIGRIGQLPRTMTLQECAVYVKEHFQLTKVKVFGDGTSMVKNVAICPGSGGSVIKDAIGACVDVLITGDINHHEGIDAKMQGVNIIDAGHYGIEKIFIPYMQQYMNRKMPELKVYCENAKEPFWYI